MNILLLLLSHTQQQECDAITQRSLQATCSLIRDSSCTLLLLCGCARDRRRRRKQVGAVDLFMTVLTQRVHVAAVRPLTPHTHRGSGPGHTVYSSDSMILT